jgi:hypothetical protein
MAAAGARVSEDAALDQARTELYRMWPGEFVAARDARVRAARQAGDRALATALGKLRRPTQAAWLANLLVAEDREAVDALLALGEQLRAAQQTLRGAELRRLSAERRRVVVALVASVRRRAAEGGHPVADEVAAEVADTLEAALTEPAAAAAVRSGALTTALHYAGWGPAPDRAAADAGAPAPPSGPPPVRKAAAREAAVRDAEARDAEARDAEARAAEARQHAEELAQNLSRAAESTAAAAQRVEQLREQLAEAERTLGASRRHERDLTREVTAARRLAGTAQRRAEALRTRTEQA